MLLHQIINSKDTRFLKEIVEEQIRDTFSGCWYEQTKEICDKYNVGLQLVKCLSKRKLKNILKSRINNRLDRYIKEEAKNKTKLRFCSDFKRKKYTKKGSLSFNDAKSIMKLRLNMIEAWTSKLTGRKTDPTSIPLVGRDVKYNAMASLS